jgi:hypothetical protein
MPLSTSDWDKLYYPNSDYSSTPCTAFAWAMDKAPQHQHSSRILRGLDDDGLTIDFIRSTTALIVARPIAGHPLTA